MVYKIAYWVSTLAVCLLMLFSASMYILNNEMAQEAFVALGYPVYLIYPLAVAKLLAIVAILTKKSVMLKEWAYAGLFFDFVLAALAHIAVNDNQESLAVIAIVLLVTSYILDRRLFPQTAISSARVDGE